MKTDVFGAANENPLSAALRVWRAAPLRREGAAGHCCPPPEAETLTDPLAPSPSQANWGMGWLGALLWMGKPRTSKWPLIKQCPANRSPPWGAKKMPELPFASEKNNNILRC